MGVGHPFTNNNTGDACMNTTIKKTINGQHVAARPIYKGGAEPAYWSAIVNQRSLPRMFTSASEIFRFAARLSAP